jgi:hypothetical protein
MTGRAIFPPYKYLGTLPEMPLHQSGFVVSGIDSLAGWMRKQDEWNGDTLTVTFVVLVDGRLAVAPRRSEHVVCAGGQDVLAAGELELRAVPTLEVASASNQSTGYCPDPECWRPAFSALQAVGIPAPDALTFAFEFRRCEHCRAINVIKEDWLYCAECGSALPKQRNVHRAQD